MAEFRQTEGSEVRSSPRDRFHPSGAESGPLSQFGALCWRRTPDGIQVLLVTSRDTGRWIIPKGWPVPGMAPEESAMQEAWEEAGVRGTADPRALGVYCYDKVIDRSTTPPRSVPCVVMVFAVETAARVRDFPEADERRHKWLSRTKAARRIAEPELAALISTFDPDAPGRA